jgi:hypothetical protein
MTPIEKQKQMMSDERPYVPFSGTRRIMDPEAFKKECADRVGLRYWAGDVVILAYKGKYFVQWKHAVPPPEGHRPNLPL